MNTEMRQALQKRWLEALRSGEYKQGRRVLRKLDTYCCLGVLCNLYDPSNWHQTDYEESAAPIYKYYDRDSYPPPNVLLAVGLEKQEAKKLAMYNDRFRMPFEQIASILEKHFSGERPIEPLGEDEDDGIGI
jgi:hypothetical protein